MNNGSVVPGFGWLTSIGSKQVFKHICDKYALVYFGSVNQHRDEHVMVRGVTLSTSHRDKHYSVGNIQGHDVILLERTDTVFFPTKKREDYTWFILQVDLRNVDMPHTFMDSGHHDEAFYDNLFAKFARLSHVDRGVFEEYDPAFIRQFRVYAPPDGADSLPTFLSRDVAAELARRFGHFDFEWYQDHLLIYSTGRPATVNLLERMIKAGVWLADEFNLTGPKKAASERDSPMQYPARRDY